jgi:hypothetical protein
MVLQLLDGLCECCITGGFGSTLLGLTKNSYELSGDSVGNGPGSYKEPGIGWMTAFLFSCSFGGLLTLIIPLRQVPLTSCFYKG